MLRNCARALAINSLWWCVGQAQWPLAASGFSQGNDAGALVDQLIECVLPHWCRLPPQTTGSCVIGRIRAVNEGDCRLIHSSCWQHMSGSLPERWVYWQQPRVLHSRKNLIVARYADQSQQHRMFSCGTAAQKWRSIALAATQERNQKHAARWRSLAKMAHGPPTEFGVPPTQRHRNAKDLIRNRPEIGRLSCAVLTLQNLWVRGGRRHFPSIHARACGPLVIVPLCG